MKTNQLSSVETLIFQKHTWKHFGCWIGTSTVEGRYIWKCVREGAPDFYNKLKEIEMPELHIVKNLLSRRKQKDKKVLKKYSKLHIDQLLEMKTLFTIVRNNGDLKRMCKKWNNKPQKQRKKKCQKTINFEVSLSSVKFVAIELFGPHRNF